MEDTSASCCEIATTILPTSGPGGSEGGLGGIFDTTGFPARWHCGTWSEALGWTHIVSDLMVWAAYMAIPVVLAYFTIRRRDVLYPMVFWLFIAFIFACGTTHLIEAIIFWHPIYRFAALIKAVTAVISWLTVIALIPTIPKALALPRLAVINESLNTEVAERRRAEAALTDSVRQLQVSNEQLGAYVYSVSHDLKSPLVTIHNLVGLLKDSLANKETEHIPMIAQQIEETTVRMNDTIHDLLEFSRMGHASREAVKVSLDAIVQEVLERHGPRIKACGVRMMVAGPLPQLMGHPGQLLCIMDNLVDNAISYACDRPGATVEIGSKREGGELRVFVKDNGPGIDPKYHERIFQLFERLEARKKGTGVGLAMVRRAMDVHAGRAWVESVPGAGATFWLAFPQAPSA